MRPTSARRRLIALLASVPAVLAAPAVASDSQDTPLSPAITAIMAKPQYAIAAWGILDAGAGARSSTRAEPTRC